MPVYSSPTPARPILTHVAAATLLGIAVIQAVHMSAQKRRLDERIELDSGLGLRVPSDWEKVETVGTFTRFRLAGEQAGAFWVIAQAQVSSSDEGCQWIAAYLNDTIDHIQAGGEVLLDGRPADSAIMQTSRYGVSVVVGQRGVEGADMLVLVRPNLSHPADLRLLEHIAATFHRES